MTAHDHREFVPGCYRCELGRDEAADSEWVPSNGLAPSMAFGGRRNMWSGALWDCIVCGREQTDEPKWTVGALTRSGGAGWWWFCSSACAAKWLASRDNPEPEYEFDSSVAVEQIPPL